MKILNSGGRQQRNSLLRSGGCLEISAQNELPGVWRERAGSAGAFCFLSIYALQSLALESLPLCLLMRSRSFSPGISFPPPALQPGVKVSVHRGPGQHGKKDTFHLQSGSHISKAKVSLFFHVNDRVQLPVLCQPAKHTPETCRALQLGCGSLCWLSKSVQARPGEACAWLWGYRRERQWPPSSGWGQSPRCQGHQQAGHCGGPVSPGGWGALRDFLQGVGEGHVGPAG